MSVQVWILYTPVSGDQSMSAMLLFPSQINKVTYFSPLCDRKILSKYRVSVFCIVFYTESNIGPELKKEKVSWQINTQKLGKKVYIFYYPLSQDKGYYHEIIIPLEPYKTGDTAECYHAHGMWLAHDNSIPWTHCYYEMSISPHFLYINKWFWRTDSIPTNCKFALKCVSCEIHRY